MTSRKVFVSCLPGDEKYATVQGHPVGSIKGVKVVTSQKLYSAEDLESADTYFLIVTSAYLEAPWMNFEMGVALSRHQRRGARVVAILRDVQHDKLPTLLRAVLAEPTEPDDSVFLDWPAFGDFEPKRR